MSLEDKRCLQGLYEKVKEEIRDFYKDSRGVITHWKTDSQEWRDYEEQVGPFYGKVLNALYELNLAIEERMERGKDQDEK